MLRSRLDLGREAILLSRQHAGSLDERRPCGRHSLHRAAWAGLQDSVPRAALLSIHARVQGALPGSWEDPSLVQVWGPRYSAYVVAARDIAIFTLGRWPDHAATRRTATDLAARLQALLDGRRMAYSDAGRALGERPNRLRYAALTGTVAMRWDGARPPTIWTLPPPAVSPEEARLELARRYLHVLGPATPAAFAQWAGIRPRLGAAAFDALGTSLMPVRTPVGDAWILAEDEPTFRTTQASVATPRFLPSGDAYLLAGDRELLVPDASHRRALWPTGTVWPGGLLVEGEIVGTWRRAQGNVTISLWRRLSRAKRDAVEAEASAMPLPDVRRPISVRWED